MNLLQGDMGLTYTINGLELANKNTQRRLEMLGILEGTQIRILNKKKSGTMIVKVRDTRFAISAQIASGIGIEV